MIIRATRSDSPLQVRSVLEKLLNHSDAVTIGNADRDPTAVALMEQFLDELHAFKHE